jgi:hypothetical protein
MARVFVPPTSHTLNKSNKKGQVWSVVEKASPPPTFLQGTGSGYYSYVKNYDEVIHTEM